MRGGEFAYDVGAKRNLNRFGDEVLLKSLRGFLATGPRRPTLRAYDRWKGGVCKGQTIAMRFGGWAEALERVGMRGVRRTRYSAEELVRRLDETWVKLGFRPGGRLLMLKANISYAPYRERWGSLRAACEALARHKKGEISREELLRGNERAREGREALPAKMRYAVMERDGFRCVVCGASAAETPGVVLEVDHMRAWAKGGRHEMGNLRTTCRECNRGKGISEA
jgi:5-methylcytosine-specific restriction endonuclease McrA